MGSIVNFCTAKQSKVSCRSEVKQPRTQNGSQNSASAAYWSDHTLYLGPKVPAFKRLLQREFESDSEREYYWTISRVTSIPYTCPSHPMMTPSRELTVSSNIGESNSWEHLPPTWVFTLKSKLKRRKTMIGGRGWKRRKGERCWKGRV